MKGFHVALIVPWVKGWKRKKWVEKTDFRIRLDMQWILGEKTGADHANSDTRGQRPGAVVIQEGEGKWGYKLACSFVSEKWKEGD